MDQLACDLRTFLRHSERYRNQLPTTVAED